MTTPPDMQPEQTPRPAGASPDAPGAAPARPRPPAWKVVLAYAALFALACASIRLIDGHVLKIAAEEEAARQAATRPAPR